jgi:hypothetical protein
MDTMRNANLRNEHWPCGSFIVFAKLCKLLLVSPRIVAEKVIFHSLKVPRNFFVDPTLKEQRDLYCTLSVFALCVNVSTHYVSCVIAYAVRTTTALQRMQCRKSL